MLCVDSGVDSTASSTVTEPGRANNKYLLVNFDLEKILINSAGLFILLSLRFHCSQSESKQAIQLQSDWQQF